MQNNQINILELGAADALVMGSCTSGDEGGPGPSSRRSCS
ncbi:hypothetical protein Cyrtocomes_01038 [Candidatus Cyrtobacter comes]|uniref:Uncharacterized protein n=1 Tax=Candidatus Cyrtobacter comes TaxID=675776 RepID=A0ABU5L938_9RICK|nr:hypothetical protein [Candidatus Cyrtobacter comes]